MSYLVASYCNETFRSTKTIGHAEYWLFANVHFTGNDRTGSTQNRLLCGRFVMRGFIVARYVCVGSKLAIGEEITYGVNNGKEENSTP